MLESNPLIAYEHALKGVKMIKSSPMQHGLCQELYTFLSRVTNNGLLETERNNHAFDLSGKQREFSIKASNIDNELAVLTSYPGNNLQ